MSGLATAHWLHRQNIDFTILEAGNEPGGSIKTVKENGYTIDFDPNSGLETSPFIRELVSRWVLTMKWFMQMKLQIKDISSKMMN
ncbi:MAG: FAD-dependent oxidoreductase [Ignavibacteriales bacterium]|nr:FAD-dependent oxidoreductase [Ignavibacteriales bacterium]